MAPSLAQRAFIITIAVQAIIVVAMVAATFGVVREELGDTFDQSSYKTLPCYLSLFILAEIFELFMALDALRSRNIIQLLGIILFHCALIVFAALQVHETRVALMTNCTLPQCLAQPDWLWDKVEPFLIVAPCVIGASWVFLIFWIKRLYQEFGWAIFRVVSADPALKTMYQFYQIFICLLKFDFFCFVGVSMQLLIVVLATNSAEFGITIAAIPVVLFLIAGCAYAVQQEIKWMMSIALTLMIPCMTYFVYKLVRFYLPTSEGEYITTRATLTVFTVVAFLLLLITFLVGLKCFHDFGKGLLGPKTQDINPNPNQQRSSFSKTPGGIDKRDSGYVSSPSQLPMSIE